MWKRKVLKKKGRQTIRKNYWITISVCFLTAILTSAYPLSGTFLDFRTSTSASESAVAFIPEISNSQAVLETVSHFFRNTFLYDLLTDRFSALTGFLIDLFSQTISTFFTILRTIAIFINEPFNPAMLFLAPGVILTFLYKVFIDNLIQIGEKRFFLEIRNYRQTPISKLFFLYKLRCLTNPAWIMWCRSLFQLLWNFTIIGGIIKHYEYSMIPFLLAENPKMSRKDAFTLSRQLTSGSKWKIFRMDLSFLGWKILCPLTFGISDFLYANAYITSSRTELYMHLRRNYVLSRSALYEKLSDSFLEHVPSEDELLISKALYDDSQGPYTKISYFEPEQYPVFLFSVQPPFRAVRSPIKPCRKYKVSCRIFLFYAFSIFGWILHTLIQLIQNGTMPETTVLHGPWLPIFGLCGSLILVIGQKFLNRPAVVFFLNAVIYSLAEYTINVLFEWYSGSPLRDYSEYFLNLNGKIYAGSSILFALLGCAFLYYLAPRWADRFNRRSRVFRNSICLILSALFAADLILTIMEPFHQFVIF